MTDSKEAFNTGLLIGILIGVLVGIAVAQCVK